MHLNRLQYQTHTTPLPWHTPKKVSQRIERKNGKLCKLQLTYCKLHTVLIAPQGCERLSTFNFPTSLKQRGSQRSKHLCFHIFLPLTTATFSFPPSSLSDRIVVAMLESNLVSFRPLILPREIRRFSSSPTQKQRAKDPIS